MNNQIVISTLLVAGVTLTYSMNSFGINVLQLFTADTFLAMYLSFLIVAFLPYISRKNTANSQKEEEVKFGTFS